MDKRPRPESPISPFAPIYADESPAEGSPEPKRRRIEDSADLVDSHEAKLIQDDLLDILDDSDGRSDLDYVIKSFEVEINVQGQQPTPSFPDLAPDGHMNELGYLLEASDDELGLPPSFANSADENLEILDLPDVSSSAFSLPFDGEMPNYDGFDLGPEINNNIGSKDAGNGNEEFVMLGGLFDFTDNCDVLEVIWRPESLPAV